MKDEWKQYSTLLSKDIYVHLEKHETQQFECSRCGKAIKNFYVVQDDDGVECLYLGMCCIKKLI